MEKRTVPSFGSFKPRTAAAAPVQKDTSKEDRERSSTESRKERGCHDEDRRRSHARRDRSRDRRRERKDDRHRKDREHQSRHKGDDERCQPTATPPLATTQTDEAEFFMIDRRGDSKNVEYGGLHRYSIPSYHRIGYGRVLGADEYAKIDRDASSEKGIIFRFDRGKAGGRAERLLSKKNLKHAGSQRLILPQAGNRDADMPTDLDADFLALRPSLKRKRGSESPEQSVPDIDYRSVEGKAKPDARPQDEDLELESSSDEAQADIASDTRIRARNAELSRGAKADPTNADAWLALIEHQAQSTFPGIDLDDLSSSQRRAFAEVRLSVLNQAFEHILASSAGHERLLLAYISEGSKIWDAPKLTRKWKDALKQHPASLSLWREYLSSLQTDHATFRYDICKDAYLKCLETLNKRHTSADTDAKSTIGDTIVYVLLRLTNLVRDAGYDELAIAIWQTVLEYYIFPPEIPSGQSKLDVCEKFWESDVPRIGEEGAAGWRASTSGCGLPLRQTSKEMWPAFDSEKPSAGFATAENSMAGTFFLPAGTAEDEEESDDPFRYVMFSDIRPILERLPEQLDTKLLIDALLCFMRLPPVDQRCAFPHEWQSDPFLQSSPSLQGSNDVKSQRHDSFFLFCDAFKSFPPNDASNFVHRALSALVTASSDYEELGEYVLAFLSRTNPSETTKTAKRLLKSRPTSLRYYNAYALSAARPADPTVELEKATQIWTKALELSPSLSEDVRDDAILLWHSWAMTLLHHRNDETARQVLLTAPDGSAAALSNTSGATSAGAVLRARRHFEENFDRMVLKQKAKHAALYADCLAWLLYLSADHDVAAALQSFATTSTRLHRENSKHALELLHQAKARLLGRHMAAKRPFRPTLFRDELADSKRLFPENSFILGQYYEVTKLTRLDDRLRSAMSEANTSAAAVSQQGLVSWLFAIDAEIARCSVDGASATKESVRALFRRALLSSDSVVKSSQLLWKRWFDFESESLKRSGQETVQRSDAVRSAKQVFFDGLRFLPWSKSWIVDEMATFAESGDMSEGELRQVHDVLVERELRVRVEVEDPERDG